MAPTRQSKPAQEPSDIISIMNSKFEEMSGKITNISGEICSFREEISSLLRAKQHEIDQLKEKVAVLENHVSKLQNCIDDQEAYERRDCLVLSGLAIPEFTIGENSSNVVRDLIQNKLKIHLNEADISLAHRIGPKPIVQGQDKRKIMVKLCRRHLKRDILFAAKNQVRNGDGPHFYVNESLTAARNKIFFTLRKIKKSHPSLVAGCSSFEGRIFAYTKDPNNSTGRNRRHLVTTHEQLVDFCREYVKLPLDTFLSQLEY